MTVPRPLHSDVEPGCAAACLQREECTHKYIYIYIYIYIYMYVCTHMHRGTLVNVCRILTRKRRNCWIKLLFLFSLSTKKYYSQSFITLRLNVTWTFLTMSLLPFWALNFSVVLLSMESQKSLWFHPKYLNLYSEDERSYRFGTTWGWVINDRIFIFEWTNPLTKDKSTRKTLFTLKNKRQFANITLVLTYPQHRASLPNNVLYIFPVIKISVISVTYLLPLDKHCKYFWQLPDLG